MYWKDSRNMGRLLSWSDVGYSVALLSVLLILFAGPLFFESGFAYKLDIDYFFAHETVLREELSGDGLALWNPYFGGGSPTLSKIQIGIFYPPLMLLRELLSPVAMFNWDMVLHLYVAGLGLYWLLRDWKVRPVGAMFGALTFMLSGSLIPRVFAGHISVIHSIAWIGWLLLAYRRLLLKRSWWSLLVVALLTALTVLGGHPQMSLIALLVPGSYFIAFAGQRIRERRWDDVGWAALSSLGVAVLALGLVAIQLAPFLEWLSQTSRGKGEAGVVTELMTRDSLYPHELFTIFFPYLWVDMSSVVDAVDVGGKELFWEKSIFAGMVTMVVIAVGLLLRCRSRGLDLRTRYLLGLGLFGLIMGMGSINPLYLLLQEIAPYFRSPGRFLLLWSFAISALAGISLDYVWRNLTLPQTQEVIERVRARWAGFVFVTLGLSVIWLLVGREVIAASELREYVRDVILNGFSFTLRTATMSMLLVLLLLWVTARRPWRIQPVWSHLVLGVALFELLLFARPLVRPQPVEELYDPNHPLAQLRPEADEVRVDGLREPPNYLVPTLRHVTNGEEHEAVELLLDLPDGAGRRFLGAGYYATTRLLESNRYELVQSSGHAYLYRERGTLPRIYAAPAIQLTYSDKEALEAISSPSFNPGQRAVVTVQTSAAANGESEHGHKPLLVALQSAEAGSAEFEGAFTDYEPDVVRATVQSGSRLMIIFNELYYPGWKATVDGKPVPVWKVNYAFRGVMVGPGTHEIEMRFESPLFELGKRITVATLLLAGGLSALLLLKQVSLKEATLRPLTRPFLRQAGRWSAPPTRRNGANRRPYRRGDRNTHRSPVH